MFMSLHWCVSRFMPGLPTWLVVRVTLKSIINRPNVLATTKKHDEHTQLVGVGHAVDVCVRVVPRLQPLRKGEELNVHDQGRSGGNNRWIASRSICHRCRNRNLGPLTAAHPFHCHIQTRNDLSKPDSELERRLAVSGRVDLDVLPLDLHASRRCTHHTASRLAPSAPSTDIACVRSYQCLIVASHCVPVLWIIGRISARTLRSERVGNRRLDDLLRTHWQLNLVTGPTSRLTLHEASQ